MLILYWVQNPPERPDVFSFILKAYEEGPKTKQDTLNLHGDAYLIIVAGRYRDLSSPSSAAHDSID